MPHNDLCMPVLRRLLQHHGEIISIQEQVDTYRFRIGYTDGEERIVTVDSDKRELFRNQQQEDKKSIACPSSGNGHP